jgi:hypothetical protein
VFHWNTAYYSIQHSRTRVSVEHGFLVNITFQDSRDTGKRLPIQYNIPELVCHWKASSYSIQHSRTCVPREHILLFNITFQNSCVSGTRLLIQHPVLDCCGTAARHFIQNPTARLVFNRKWRFLLTSNSRTEGGHFIQHSKAGPVCQCNTAFYWTPVCRTTAFYSARHAMSGAASL